FAQDAANQAVRRRAGFRRLEDHGVTAGERNRDSPHTGNDRCILWRDTKDHAGRLPHRERERSGHVGGNNFAKHVARQNHIEEAPAGGGSGLSHHQAGELGGAGVEEVGSAQKFGTAGRRAEGTPRRESFGGCVRGGDRTPYGSGSSAAGYFTGD